MIRIHQIGARAVTERRERGCGLCRNPSWLPAPCYWWGRAVLPRGAEIRNIERTKNQNYSCQLSAFCWSISRVKGPPHSSWIVLIWSHSRGFPPPGPGPYGANIRVSDPGTVTWSLPNCDTRHTLMRSHHSDPGSVSFLFPDDSPGS